MKKIKMPRIRIGLRMFKSMLGVFLSFAIYFIRGKRGAPFYTCIAVLQCMRSVSEDNITMAKQRTTGTFIGCIYGLIMIILFNDCKEWLRYLIISIMIIPILYTVAVVLNKKNAAYFACVVFLSITVNHLTDKNPYLFVYNRAMDTLIGIILSLLINSFRLPFSRQNDILFVSTMDETLLNMQNTITSYSQYQLNRMLKDGMNFTVASMRTPATLIDNLKGINITLPIIAMDGAVLFDMKRNHYIKKYELSYFEAKNFIDYIQVLKYHVFINVLIEDSWLIYYNDFYNEAEERIYNDLKCSPYRNYIKQNLPANQSVLYLMIVDTIERIDHLYLCLSQKFDLNQYKVLKYKSQDYSGYAYLKIYSKEATKKRMIEVLKKNIGMDKLITFGSIEGQYDYVIKDSNSNEVVKILKKKYEPVKLFFRK